MLTMLTYHDQVSFGFYMMVKADVIKPSNAITSLMLKACSYKWLTCYDQVFYYDGTSEMCLEHCNTRTSLPNVRLKMFGDEIEDRRATMCIQYAFLIYLVRPLKPYKPASLGCYCHPSDI